MIVAMKRLALLCMAAEKSATLEALRRLGAVHLDLGSARGAEVVALKGELADAEKAVLLVEKARKASAAKDAPRAAMSVPEILAVAAESDRLKAEADALEREVEFYAPFGDFDPALARRLLERGIDLKSVAELPDPLPPKRLSEMAADLAAMRAKLSANAETLASADSAAVRRTYPELADRLAFGAAKELMAERGPIAFVCGWIPEPKIPALKACVAANGWGVAVRDPEPGEIPPTLVEPPRMFRPMKALFEGLGISPAYDEADVSVPFMCYFSLFFAMLVGDGAYGAIFLAGTLFGWRAFAKGNGGLAAALRGGSPVAKSWLVLMTVFSLATVAWGALSNTWFGAGIPCCAGWPTVKWLADPSYHNMMLLCFTVGVSHLMLARVWNGVCKAPDSTCLAEFGWAGVLLFMYFVTNSIVGIFSAIPVWAFWTFGVSLACVFAFTVKPSELKTRGAELGMLPLNVMSALGDIISYVRLFAVGLASVKVAENFNSMAVGLVEGADAAWAKALMSLAMVAILVVGHGLNLAMAGLSILVHAVRLNTLEFSNHKGVSWAGYAFRPFRAKSARG